MFKKFKFMVERKSGKKLKVLKIDGGGKYVSNDSWKFYDQEEIVNEVVSSYTPQQKVCKKGRIDQS